MKQRIKIEGKNLGDLFALPCVKGITKTDDGSFRVRVKLATRQYVYAEPGWWIEEEDGKWTISPM